MSSEYSNSFNSGEWIIELSLQQRSMSCLHWIFYGHILMHFTMPVTVLGCRRCSVRRGSCGKSGGTSVPMLRAIEGICDKSLLFEILPS